MNIHIAKQVRTTENYVNERKMKKIWNSQNWNSWENSRQRLQLAKRIFVILFSSFLLIYGVFLFPCYSLQFVADLLWILPEIKSYPYSGIPLACSRTFIVIQSFIRKHSINSLYGIIHEYHVSLVQYTLTKVNGILRRNNSTINVRDFCCFYFHLLSMLLHLLIDFLSIL